MLKINDMVPSITINLDNGIYLFETESGTGKTRLAKLMKKYGMYGKPVNSYTYDDYKYLGRNIDEVLKPDLYKAIVIDRFDLYCGEMEEQISKYKDDMIIMIDSKVENNFKFLLKTCYIDLEQNSIEVHL